MDALTDCPHCGSASETAEFAAEHGRCPVCGHYHEELDMARHYSSRIAAGAGLTGDDLWHDHANEADYYGAGDDPYAEVDYDADPHELRRLRRERNQEWSDDFPEHYSSLRVAAIEFVAAQNTADRGELMFRAHRHASNLTGQLPVAQARDAVKAFVAAVAAEAPRPRRQRTAAAPATVADFDDQLLFDS